MLDQECDDPDDPSEGFQAAGDVKVTFEGLYKLSSSLAVAYLSYENASGSPITIPIGDNADTKNFLSAGNPDQGQPILFAPGRYLGAIKIPVTVPIPQPLVWTLKAKGAPEQRIEILPSKILPPVQPTSQCISLVNDVIVAVLGYVNPNGWPIFIPRGDFNYFTPGEPNRQQPESFVAGRVNASTKVELEGEVTWMLAEETAKVSPNTDVCNCPKAKNSDAKEKLRKISQDLGELGFVAATRLEDASEERLSGATRSGRERLKAAIKRSKERASVQVLDVRSFTDKLPSESRTCVQQPNGCKLVDDGPTIDAVRTRYYDTLLNIKRVLARASFLDEASKDRNAKLSDQAEGLVAQGVEVLNSIPRFRTDCSQAPSVR